jgi:hypothetical protein
MVSADFEMHAQLRMDFGDTLEASAIDGCLWFKPTEALQKREPKTYAVIMTTGANVDGDGFFSIKLAGSVGGIKRLAQGCRPKA